MESGMNIMHIHAQPDYIFFSSYLHITVITYFLWVLVPCLFHQDKLRTKGFNILEGFQGFTDFRHVSETLLMGYNIFTGKMKIFKKSTNTNLELCRQLRLNRCSIVIFHWGVGNSINGTFVQIL